MMKQFAEQFGDTMVELPTQKAAYPELPGDADALAQALYKK